ncbi:MAG: Eco57I restriction-modification methylase domain-containing protein [Alphaproteobacteria bacterium]
MSPNPIEKLINQVSKETIVSFLRSKSDFFTPQEEDLPHHIDEDSFCSSLKKLGEIEFGTGSKLIVLLGELEKGLSERSSKKAQYDIAKKAIKEGFYDAGIFVFTDNEGKARFSFINVHYAGKKREFGNYKRYTYFIDPKKPNKTFRTQIGKADFSSITNILKAFSIDAVTNEFYNEFKPKFEQIAKSVKEIEDTSTKEDFALLFVIRTIFIGFVQKRGWLGGDQEFLQNFWLEYKAKFNGDNKFYKNWLEPLFFEALNSTPGTQVKYRNNDFSEKTQKTLQMAPFLNGELFKQKTGVDLASAYIPDKEIEAFFEFLFQYNFTIEENTNYDEELELNPEFLGIIFERLVNKKDGAVYTPRTEVDLMCRLSLVKWLEKNSNCTKQDLYHFIFREMGVDKEFDECQKQGDFTAKEIKGLIELLQNITICDPAAGSGAFEVGMMQVLDELLGSLQTRNNCPDEYKNYSAFDRKKEIIAKSLYGVEVKRWAVWINQLRLWLSLFIDMPEDKNTSFEPLLPSLNFKVRCGDSLVQRIGGKLFPIQGHASISQSIKAKVTKLKNAKIDFFNNKNGVDIHSIRNMEKNLFLDLLHDEITNKKEKLNEYMKTYSKQGSLIEFGEKTKKENSASLEKEKEQLREEIALLQEEAKNLTDNHPLVWNIEFAEIFGEKGGFDIIIGNPPYVRQEEISDPNGLVKDNKDYKDLLEQTVKVDYPSYFKAKTKTDKKSDLYVYFYLHTLRILNPKGIHCFVCSNSWLDVGYGAWLQEFLLNNVEMHYIIDNQVKRSFANADVNTIISIFSAPEDKFQKKDKKVKFVAFKKPFEEVVVTENLLEIENTNGILKTGSFRVYSINYDELYEAGVDENKYIGDKWGGKYLRAPDIFFTILEKGKDKLVKLKDVAEVRRGITTGCNEFFYLTDTQAKEWGIEEEFLKPATMKTNELKKIDVSKIKPKGFLFLCDKSKTELQGTNALKYIKWGEIAEIEIKQGKDKGKKLTGFHNIETVKNRKLWYFLGDRKEAEILWIIAHNDRNIAFLNSDRLVGDNFFEITVCKTNKINTLLFLNSTTTNLFRELYGRSNFGGGVLKTQKPDLNNFILLKDDCVNFSKLNTNNLFNREIKNIFEECGIDPKSDIPIEEQEPKPLADRKELDDIVFDAIGLTIDERKEVYRSVCQLVYNRISKAKSV